MGEFKFFCARRNTDGFPVDIEMIGRCDISCIRNC